MTANAVFHFSGVRAEIKLLFQVLFLCGGKTNGNSETPWGLGSLTTFGFNGQEQLKGAPGPALAQPREGVMVSPEGGARPALCTPLSRGFFPEVQLTFLGEPLNTSLLNSAEVHSNGLGCWLVLTDTYFILVTLSIGGWGWSS